MADDKTKKGPTDASKVNVHEDYEVQYWCKKFGCTQLFLLIRLILQLDFIGYWIVSSWR